jgi:hypothetical protein
MKVKHLFWIGLGVIGLLYVGHMMMSHQGQGILPGLGIGGH